MAARADSNSEVSYVDGLLVIKWIHFLVVYKIFVYVFVEGLYLGHINSNNIDFHIEIVLEDTYPVLVIVIFVSFADF